MMFPCVSFLWGELHSSSVGLWEKGELTPRQVTHARVFSLREWPSYPKTNGFAGINKTAIVQMQPLLIWLSTFFKNLLLEKKPSPSWYQLISDSAFPYVYVSSPICISDMYIYVCIHICICVHLHYMYHLHSSNSPSSTFLCSISITILVTHGWKVNHRADSYHSLHISSMTPGSPRISEL